MVYRWLFFLFAAKIQDSTKMKKPLGSLQPTLGLDLPRCQDKWQKSSNSI
jgi:hypothetical protein